MKNMKNKSKRVQEEYKKIMLEIPKENHEIVGNLLYKLSLAWHPNENRFAEDVNRIHKDVIEKYSKVEFIQLKFQIKNGNIASGTSEIVIRDHIAKIVRHRVTLEMKLLIDAHGGQEIDIAEIAESDLTPAAKLLIEANGGEILVEEKRPKPRKRQAKEVTDDDSTST